MFNNFVENVGFNPSKIYKAMYIKFIQLRYDYMYQYYYFQFSNEVFLL